MALDAARYNMILCLIPQHDRYYSRALRHGQQGNLCVKLGAPGIPLCRVSPPCCQMAARSVSCGARRHAVGRVVTNSCPCAPRQQRDVNCVTEATDAPVRSLGGLPRCHCRGRTSRRICACLNHALADTRRRKMRNNCFVM